MPLADEIVKGSAMHDGSEKSEVKQQLTTGRRAGSLVFAVTILVTALILVAAYRVLPGYFRPEMGPSLEIDTPIPGTISVRAGEAKRVSYDLRNRSDSPITVYGVKTSCGCLSATNLPLTIPPRQDRRLDFEIRTTVAQVQGRVVQEATLFTDARSPTYRIQIEISVGPAPPPMAG